MPSKVTDGTTVADVIDTHADNTANTTNGVCVAAFGYAFDGTTWDRLRGDSTNGLLVNLGTNHDVDLAEYGGSAVGAGNAVHVQPGTAATWDVSDRAARDCGKIDIAAFDVELPAGTQNIGDVDVASGPTGASALQVQGTVAENAAAANNVVLVAGRYDATPRTLGDGDAGAIALDADGAVHISGGGNTITVDGTVAATQSGTWNVEQSTHDSLQCNANAQQGDADVAAGNALYVQPGTGAVFQVQSNSANLGTETTLDAVKSAVEIMDDWDETDRCAVNLISGQAAITGNAGAVAANTPRVTLGSDDPAVTALQIIDDWDDGSDNAKVVGSVADDAADSGNPVKIGGKAVETDNTDPGEVAENDRADLRTDLNRRLLVNTRHPRGFSANENHSTAQTNNSLQAAPGAGYHLYITDIIMSTDTAMNIKLVEDTAGTPADVAGPYYFAANGGIAARLTTPVRVTENKDLGFTSSAAGNHTITVLGYIGP
jgi:hypothetical protein